MKVRYRVFNGKKYSSGGIFPTKAEAEKRARYLRSGYYGKKALARVVKVKGGYEVWGKEK